MNKLYGDQKLPHRKIAHEKNSETITSTSREPTGLELRIPTRAKRVKNRNIVATWEQRFFFAWIFLVGIFHVTKLYILWWLPKISQIYNSKILYNPFILAKQPPWAAFPSPSRVPPPSAPVWETAAFGGVSANKKKMGRLRRPKWF